MTTQELVESWERGTFERGLEKGFEKGLARGLAQGVLDVYEARFGAVPDSIRRTVEGAKDPARLRGWLKLVALGAAEDVRDRLGRGH
jgi:hypothetical protein